MADLEELAVKRDRGFLVRLLLALGAALIASLFVWQAITGDSVSGCMANAFLGQPAQAPVAPPAAEKP
jgi:hypothetical protein